MEYTNINGKEFVRCYGKARGKQWTEIYYPADLYKVKKSKTKTAKKLKEGACDRLWSNIVRINAGFACEHCGKQGKVDAHHIITRSDKNLRWDLENGICLCSGCHTLSSKFSAHKTPNEFRIWLEKNFPERYANLKFKSNVRQQKQDINVIYLYLQQEMKNIKGLML